MRTSNSCCASGTLLLGLAVLLSSCSGDPSASTDGGSEQALGTQSQALYNASWRVWDALPSNPNGFDGSPALCSAETATDTGSSNGGGWALVGQDEGSGRYRLMLYQFFTPYTDWADLGDRSFSSSPAIANLDGHHSRPLSQWNNQVAVAGRSGWGNRYFIKILKLDNETQLLDPPPPGSNQTHEQPEHPTTVMDWTMLDTSAFASSPALAVNYDALLLVGRRSNNRIDLYRNVLDIGDTQAPYDHANWTLVRTLPDLPGGWTAEVDPAISADNTWGYSYVATRARSATGSRTVFYALVSGSWVSQWWQVGPVGAGVGSGPALEVDHEGVVTMYIRDTNDNIYQASTSGGPFQIIHADTFVRAPTAMGNSPLEGSHVVVAKKSDGQFWFSGLQP